MAMSYAGDMSVEGMLDGACLSCVSRGTYEGRSLGTRTVTQEEFAGVWKVLWDNLLSFLSPDQIRSEFKKRNCSWFQDPYGCCTKPRVVLEIVEELLNNR